MAGASPPSPGGRRRLRDDGLRTATSAEQTKVEDIVQEIFDAYKTKHHASQFVLQREKHFHYLKRGLRQLSSAYECLDASRPWLCYWILHSLELLDEPIPDSVASDVCQFLSRCQSPKGGFGGGPGQHPHLAPTYAAINTLCIIGTEEAFGVIDRYGQQCCREEAAGVPALTEAARRLLPHARRRRGGRQERLLRRLRGLADQPTHARALRRDGRVDRQVPELGGRHRRGAGDGGPRRVHLLRHGRLGHPQGGTSAQPPEFAALGDQPADAVRRWLPGSLQQAGGWLLLLLASRPPAPAPPCPPRQGRHSAQHETLDVRPVGAAGIHPPVLPVPGRGTPRQARKVPGFLPHLLLPERARHRPALWQRRPPPRNGPGRPREPPAGHAPRLQHQPRKGDASGDAFLAAARAQPGAGGHCRLGTPRLCGVALLGAGGGATVASRHRDGQSEVLRVLAIPKTSLPRGHRGHQLPAGHPGAPTAPRPPNTKSWQRGTRDTAELLASINPNRHLPSPVRGEGTALPPPLCHRRWPWGCGGRR